ncbi:MAG TPA: dienelactone hydrolase, partial [Polyangiaceae bacterium]|nr:dienelactone hydrolase [Polyangiaceae bacterium]
GLSVWMPSFFGTAGRKLSGPYIAGSMLRACVMREFSVFKKNTNSPVTSWLRALARHVHRECGGRGVGALGMCLTGGFALAMMVEESVIAPVLCNPSLPFALTPARKGDLGVDSATLARARARSIEGGVCLMGLRFTEDIAVPHERFQRLREEFGEHFIAIEINSGSGCAEGLSRLSHSVLGADFVADPQHPTALAESRAVTFIRDRLMAPPQRTSPGLELATAD